MSSAELYREKCLVSSKYALQKNNMHTRKEYVQIMGIYTQSSPTSNYYLAYVLKAYFNLKTSNVNIVQVIVNL